MHDLVIADLRRDGGHVSALIADALAERRQVGLDRYGSLLQAHNGRDVLRDLLEECLDAVAYARQAQVEGATFGGIDLETRLLDCAATVLLARGDCIPVVTRG